MMGAIKQRMKRVAPAWALAAWQRRPSGREITEWIDRVLPARAAVLREHIAYHHGLPNLFNPQTYSEKVLHRILFDRRNLPTQMADKNAVRSYVADRLGPEILPHVYWVTSDPATIPFEELPDRFVVKATHGSGWVRIVHNKAALDTANLVATCNRWLMRSFYDVHHEWPYKNIVPRIMVEEFIDDGHAQAPDDYKLFVFGGRVHFIQVDTDRFVGHRQGFFSPDWTKQQVTHGTPEICGDVPRPKHLQQMIAAAEVLAREIEFVRVDFYHTDQRIYFGELTTTPGCGLNPLRPYEYELLLGGLWELPKRRR